MTGTVTAFGTTADLSPLLTPDPVDDLTVTNTVPGTLIASSPGIWWDVAPQTVSVNTTTGAGQIQLIQIPKYCAGNGTFWYEIYLGANPTNQGYICGMQTVIFNNGIARITSNLTFPNSPSGSSGNYHTTPVNLTDPIANYLDFTYGSQYQLVLDTLFTSDVKLPTTITSYTVTGGRVCFMGMMYSNP